MIPGEYVLAAEPVEINAGRPTLDLEVTNTGDRPVQVGSHFHFAEVNPALRFERPAAYGYRLDIPAGTAARFEPGDARTVRLTALAGARQVHGLAGLVDGPLDDGEFDDSGFDDGGPEDSGFDHDEPDDTTLHDTTLQDDTLHDDTEVTR